MRQNYQTAKELFINRSKEKVMNFYSVFAKEKDFLLQSKNIENTYHVLKQMRDGSAIFHAKEIYDITSHLLKHFHIHDLEYELPKDKVVIIIEGFQILSRLLFSIGDQQQDSYSLSNGINQQEKITLLMLESDQFIADWLKDKLINTEFRMIYAPSESIASILLSEKIEILLIDINTEDEKAYENLKELKDHEWLSAIPVFVFTHNRSESHLTNLLKTGIDGIIQKPFSIPILLSTLRNMMKRKQNSKATYTPLHFTNQREEMKDLIKKEWIRFLRFQSYFSLLYIKISANEKQIEKVGLNEMFHFIFQFYHQVSKSIRGYDEIRSISSDTFLLLLPGTNIEGAVLVGNRILHQAKNINTTFDFMSNIILGAVESEHEYREPEEMIARLEKEMVHVVPTDSIYKVPSLSQSDNKGKRSQIKVLIVDDDPIPPTILINHFKSEEWDVEICSNGREVLDKVFQLKPDIIISETKMWDLDGYSFCYQIRQFPLFKDTIFFFLSKQSITKQIVRAFQVGADDYITKPFSAEEIEARIRRHLVKKSMLKEFKKE